MLSGIFSGEEFPLQEFAQWNVVVQAEHADQIIRNVGTPKTINVKGFIEDLS